MRGPIGTFTVEGAAALARHKAQIAAMAPRGRRRRRLNAEVRAVWGLAAALLLEELLG